MILSNIFKKGEIYNVYQINMQLKGYGKDLVFYIDFEDDLNTVLNEINKIICENKEFFIENPVNFKFNREIYSNSDIEYVNSIQKMFINQGILLNNFSQKIIEIENLVNPTYVKWKSVRAGKTLSIPDGNLILFGDVNPSAKVEVAGFLMCKGSIKGIVHAGYENNNKFEVFVYADKINSPRIQIGNKIAYNVKEKGVVLTLEEE